MTMVNSAKSSKLYRALFRNEHGAIPSNPPSASPANISPCKDLSERTIPLGTLKTTEIELQKRWQHKIDTFFPLWFHAHTERNIYLWRNGFSINDEALFEFWVDVTELIKKREDKLMLESEHNLVNGAVSTHSNPLTDPKWSSDAGREKPSTLIDDELRYLSDITSTFVKLIPHIHALSVATGIIHPSGRDLVILPIQTKKEP